jgi:hypothetical protein
MQMSATHILIYMIDLSSPALFNIACVMKRMNTDY